MALRKIDKLLQNAATSGNGNTHDLRGSSREITFYVITSDATVATGAVTFETAASEDYTGGWDPIDAAVTAVQNTVIHKRYRGVFNALRARISTAVTGGATVSVRLISS